MNRYLDNPQILNVCVNFKTVYLNLRTVYVKFRTAHDLYFASTPLHLYLVSLPLHTYVFPNPTLSHPHSLPKTTPLPSFYCIIYPFTLPNHFKVKTFFNVLISLFYWNLNFISLDSFNF